MAFKMKMKAYGQGKNPIPMKKAPTKAKTKLKDNTYVDEATMEAKADHARQQRAYAAENQSANIDDLGDKAEPTKMKSPTKMGHKSPAKAMKKSPTKAMKKSPTKAMKKSPAKVNPTQAMGGAKNKPSSSPKRSGNFPRFS